MILRLSRVCDHSVSPILVIDRYRRRSCSLAVHDLIPVRNTVLPCIEDRIRVIYMEVILPDISLCLQCDDYVSLAVRFCPGIIVYFYPPITVQRAVCRIAGVCRTYEKRHQHHDQCQQGRKYQQPVFMSHRPFFSFPSLS